MGNQETLVFCFAPQLEMHMKQEHSLYGCMMEVGVFRHLSRKAKRKLFLNIFVYYPGGLLLAIWTSLSLLKYVGLKTPPLGFMILIVTILVGIGAWHISEIYKDLLRKEGQKNGK